MATSTAMIPMTTSNSTSVKPALRVFIGAPLPVSGPGASIEEPSRGILTLNAMTAKRIYSESTKNTGYFLTIVIARAQFAAIAGHCDAIIAGPARRGLPRRRSFIRSSADISKRLCMPCLPDGLGSSIRKIVVGSMLFLALAPARALARGGADPLAVGIAGHAFDHLGEINEQADAAAASGSSIIYASGIGPIGYEGLPTPDKLKAAGAEAAAYLRHARAKGIQLAIGYVCATSIVKLATFDQNWTPEFRAQFSAPPAQWLQQDRNGKPLPSWYGGDYRPACMNNPDWRTYEKFIVRQQLEAGHDGIFFDNPTVHPDGCYCEYCMKKFGQVLAAEGADRGAGDQSVAALRKLAIARPRDFMKFRCTIASDFLADIRRYARTINPSALITCNNSLNAPEAFYSQSRAMGYNIYQMSKVEDLVVVEDQGCQPRVLPNGTATEYGPVYDLLAAISHGKPLVAVTIADTDYHTPANLMRLAMAEAAAHEASYLSWPTWPENVRQKMIAAVRPQADLLRANAPLLNGASVRADALVFVPFRRWVDTPDCQVLQTARALSIANLQFRAVCEDDIVRALAAPDAPPALIVESPGVLVDSEKAAVEQYASRGGHVIWSSGKQSLSELQSIDKTPVIRVEGPATVRAIVREKSQQTIVHLLNLNIQRISSFQDKVNPISPLHLQIRCGSTVPRSVRAITADPEATAGDVNFKLIKEHGDNVIDLMVPTISISTILLIE
jgi:hypothetical protein